MSLLLATAENFFASTLADAVLAAQGRTIDRGAFATTLGNAVLAATGRPVVRGTIAVVLQNAVMAAIGKEVVRGTFASTLDNVVFSAFGAPPTTTGGVGHVEPPAYVRPPLRRKKPLVAVAGGAEAEAVLATESEASGVREAVGAGAGRAMVVAWSGSWGTRVAAGKAEGSASLSANSRAGLNRRFRDDALVLCGIGDEAESFSTEWLE